MFRVLGHAVGRALRHNLALGVSFSDSMFAHVLDKSTFEVEELRAVDPELAVHLEQLLSEDVNGWEMFFEGADGTELCDGGGKLPLTNENKRQYVQLYVRHRLCGCDMLGALDCFRDGFWACIPLDKLQAEAVTAQELHDLIYGDPSISVKEWQEHADDQLSEPLKNWFWEILEDMTEEERRQLLQFTTSSRRLPVGGFAALKPDRFRVSAGLDPHQLPHAHTCFHHLEIPPVHNKEQLRQGICTAIQHGVGFGIG